MASKEEAPVVEEKAGGKKKLIIIIAGAAVVLIGVVVGVLMFTGKGKGGGEGEAKHGEAKAEKKAEGGGGHGGGEKGKEGGSSAIIPLDPFIVNIYDGQDIRYLRVKVEFEPSDAGAAAEIGSRQAPLRDAILVLLTTKTLRDIQDLQGKNQLRDEILNSANKILTHGKITKVYFTDFVVQ